MDKPLHIFIDTETTGLGHVANPPRDDAIIEIGIAYRNINNSIIRKSWLCNPGEKYFKDGYADEALSVSHISKEDILAARSPYEVRKDIKDYTIRIDKHTATFLFGKVTAPIFHAYNIPFDSVFLEKDPWSFHLTWGIDIMDLSRDYFGLPSSYRIRLSTSMNKLGIALDGEPHRASTDAVSAMLVYEAIMEAI